MQTFSLDRVTTVPQAIAAGREGGRFIAGGTTLVDLMRETVERPTSVVDISGLPLDQIRSTTGGGLRIGSLVTMAQAASDPRVRATLPMLSQALELSASPQLRNMATIGGNIMQRTRCSYFRDVSAGCNKREPGTGCSAIEGRHRNLAVLGTSEDCVATHASDLAVALRALDAVVDLQGTGGRRTVPLGEFLLQPGSTPDREHDIAPDEVITAIEVPAHPRPLRSGYLKVRDRQSYEFALVSAGVALHLRDGVVRRAFVAAGGVGTVPWKLRAVEERLIGERPSAALWAEAASVAADGARPLPENEFKVELLVRTVERQLGIVGGVS